MIILIIKTLAPIDPSYLKTAFPDTKILGINPHVYFLRTHESPQTLSKKFQDAYPNIEFFMFTSPSTDWVGHPESDIDSWIAESLGEQFTPLMA